MNKRSFLSGALCLAMALALPAQEADTPQEEVPVQDLVYKMNQKGDQLIKIELAVTIPFRPQIGQLNVGGGGSLGYMYFLTEWFQLGGDISFSYNTTIGSNTITLIPVLFKAAFQPTAGRFEFPITLGLGFAFENYIDRFYFGMAAKFSLGAYYRITPRWSAGIHTGLFWYPQWYAEGYTQYNYDALIMDVGLSARYHF